MIRNGKIGDIVWTIWNQKAEIVGRRDLTTKATPWRARGVYYTVKILDNDEIHYPKGTKADMRPSWLFRSEEQIK